LKKLYMVSLGPGDFELVTLKALKALKSSDVILVPTKSEGSFKKSLTHKIVKKLFEEEKFERKLLPVFSPMKFKKEDWESQVELIMEAFWEYKSVSFVTLGDCSIYSTVYYLLEIIKKRDLEVFNNCEVIAGITSFSAASAKVKKPLCLGDSSLEIIPLVEKRTPKTKVYMRPKIGQFTTNLQEGGSFYTFENLFFKDENIIRGKIKEVKKYMTLFIDFFKNEKI